MLHALLRKGIADLRTRPLQTTLLFVIVAAAATILMLAFSVAQSVKSSFDRAHAEANGAHVWFHGADAGVLERVVAQPGVVESTAVYEQARGALISHGEPDDVIFLGIGADAGGVAPATVVEGRWLARGSQAEVVVTEGLARSSDLDLGAVLNATTANASMSLRLVGIARDTSYLPYPQSSPGVVFVTQPTVRELSGGPPPRADAGRAGPSPG
jgi:hypothetical protein